MNLHGLLIDSSSRAYLPAVTVELKLLRSAKGSLQTSSDTAGKFHFSNIDAGLYRLTVKSINHKTYTLDSIRLKVTLHQLEPISLITKDNMLEEVKVTRAVKFMQIEADKTTFTIENSMLADGATALDMLNKIPGLAVSNEGKIALKGKDNVQVMINDKLTYLSPDQLANLLRGTSSLDVAKVEVISNPSSKYDAAGQSGMLNIILKKGRKLGFNGAVSVSSGAGRGFQGGGNIQLNYQNQKTNFFLSYNQYLQNLENRMHYRRVQYDAANPSTSLINVQENQENPRLRSNNFRIGMDHNFSQKSNIGMLVQGGFGKYPKTETSYNNLYKSPEETLQWQSTTLNNGRERWEDLLFNVFYTHTFKKPQQQLRIDLDYMYHYSKMDQSFETRFFDQQHNEARPLSARIGDLPSKNKIFASKVDYTHPLHEKLKLEVGYKGSWIQMDNDLRYDTLQNTAYVIDATTSNHYSYNEAIQAAYGNLHFQVNKWKIQAGLRTEYTQTNGTQHTIKERFTKDYFNFFPSLFVGYEMHDNWSFHSSFGRRINRPTFWDLNPFRSYNDQYSYDEGNPQLNPSYAQVYELGIQLFGKYHVNFSHNRTQDMINDWIGTDERDPQLTFEKPVNLGSYRQTGLSLTVPMQIGKWNATYFVHYYRNRFALPIGNAMALRRGNTLSFNSQQQYDLGKAWKIEVGGQYTGPQVLGIHTMKAYGNVYAGLQKNFLKQWNAKLTVNDIFQTNKRNYSTQTDLIYTVGQYNRDSRSVLLQLNYRFGGSTTQRVRSTSSQDMKDRL